MTPRSRVQTRVLPGGRLHLQDGPIDIVLKAWGDPDAVMRAETAAAQRFLTILDELTSELSELRRPMADAPRLATPVALRMAKACALFARDFITPMAAVAGSVADELLDVMRAAPPLDRAFVNNGGDIAVHVASGQTLAIGLATNIARGLAGALAGSTTIDAASGVGGVATSGWSGRSFSLGVADAATVLARDAASADAAATIIANAANVESRAVRRAPAVALDPDSDLGKRLVTVDVGALSDDEIEAALARGLAKALDCQRRGLIVDAAIAVKRRVVVLGSGGNGAVAPPSPQRKSGLPDLRN